MYDLIKPNMTKSDQIGDQSFFVVQKICNKKLLLQICPIWWGQVSLNNADFEAIIMNMSKGCNI